MGSISSKAVIFRDFGGPEVLQLVEVDVPPPGPGEIRVRINAFALNRSEAMFRQGWHPIKPQFPSRIGYEAAGIVESAGEGAEFAPGDRVSTLPIMSLNACGAYGEYFTIPAELAVRSPETLSDVETAALWSSYMTAYGMLIELVKIERGDWVLVTAASSSLGAPIFQILAMLGANVIATTRTRGKAEAITSMGASHVVVTEEENLAERVASITKGKGVRFAFDPIGGPIIGEIAELMCPYGTIVLYGILDFTPVNLPVMPLIGKNLSILGYAMLLDDQPERNERAIAFIREGVGKGALKPMVGKNFKLENIKEAAQYFDNLQQTGKVVLVNS